MMVMVIGIMSIKYLIYEEDKKLMVVPRSEKTSCPSPNHSTDIKSINTVPVKPKF